MPSTDVYIIKFEPVAFEIFGFAIHWYGITYLAAFSLGWMVSRYLARTHPNWKVKPEHIDDLLFYMGLGVILGGRIGYLLFYDMINIVNEPTLWDSFIRLISIHKGGMSFHGGLLGSMLAIWFFNRKYKHGYFIIADIISTIAPIGLLAGRLGNFINGELWGKPSDVAWAMIFPNANPLPGIEQDLARHPTPLYEAALEGVVLFIIIWVFARKDRPPMAISGLFVMGYGFARTYVEFYRLPDAHIGYLLDTDWLTMGMLLSAPLIVVGMILMWYSYNRKIVQKA